VNQEFSWLSSVFYFGYLAASFPASVLLVKLPLGKTISITVYGIFVIQFLTLSNDVSPSSRVIWGAMISFHAATQNLIGLCIVRVLLGIFESAISPGLSIITSIW
jgi:MFS family permease